MFGTFFDALDAQETRHQSRENQAQNAARLAFSCHNLVSTGVGSVRIPEVVTFDVAFLTRPYFTQGAAVKSGPAGGGWTDPGGGAGVWQVTGNVFNHIVADVVAEGFDGS